MTDSTEVTQDDRDAAREFVLAIFDEDNTADDTARRALEAFARHRAASTAQLEAQIAAWEAVGKAGDEAVALATAALDAQEAQIAAMREALEQARPFVANAKPRRTQHKINVLSKIEAILDRQALATG